MSTLFLYFLSILSVSNFLSFSLFLLIVLLFNFFAISNFVSISQMLCSSWNSNWFEDNMSMRIDVQDFNNENKWQILMEGSVVANVVTWLVVTSTVLTDTIWELDTISMIIIRIIYENDWIWSFPFSYYELRIARLVRKICQVRMRVKD